jgi:hypothetical protein
MLVKFMQKGFYSLKKRTTLVEQSAISAEDL